MKEIKRVPVFLKHSVLQKIKSYIIVAIQQKTGSQQYKICRTKIMKICTQKSIHFD